MGDRIRRFWLHVKKDPDTACWLWTGQKVQFGYGRLTSGVYTHRFSFWLHTGITPPKGIFVCHRCDVPACVNPDHLFLGTSRDNMMDAIAKGRVRSDGEHNARSKITRQQAEEILILHHRDGLTVRELAHKFGVSNSPITSVIRGTHWTIREKANEQPPR